MRSRGRLGFVAVGSLAFMLGLGLALGVAARPSLALASAQVRAPASDESPECKPTVGWGLQELETWLGHLVQTFHDTVLQAKKPATAEEIRRSISGLCGKYESLLDFALKGSAAGQGSLTDEELTAIYAYTAACYKSINQALRDGVKYRQAEPMIEALVAGLRKVPVRQGWVYRGVRLPPQVLERYREGAVVSDPGFVSTSLTRSFPGKQCLSLYSRSGREVNDFSAFPGENEVLFVPDTRFVVQRVQPAEQPNPLGCETEITLVELDLSLPDEGRVAPVPAPSPVSAP